MNQLGLNRFDFLVIPTNIYGENDNYDIENGHVIASLIHKCFIAKKNKETFVVCGSGKPLRQFIYSTDLARLMMWGLEYYNDNPKLFYKDEQDCVKNGIIFSLTNNNFIDYLINKSVKPEHKFKKDKKRISSSLKRKVWEEEYGNANNGRCPYKKCVNTIYKNNYSCGHIISEYNGGETDISNLRPMCHGCNNKLGKRNWT